MKTPGSNGYDICEANYVYRYKPIGGGAVAELAGVVKTPAAYSAVVEQRTGVIPPRGDGCGVSEAANERRSAPSGSGAVTELAAAIIAPATHRGVG